MDEVRAIVNAVGETGKGIFELAGEAPGRDPERIREYHTRLRDLAVESGVTQTWGMFSIRMAPDFWRPTSTCSRKPQRPAVACTRRCTAAPSTCCCRSRRHTPFDKWEVWRDVRALPLEEQKAKLRDPAIRAKLVEVANREYTGPRIVGAEARPPDWHWVFPMAEVRYDQPSMAQLAAERGVNPVELMIDLALEHDFKIYFRQPIANEDQNHVLEMMRHPRSLVTFSDSGAHVAQIMDSSLQTHLLSYWVREKQAFSLEQAIRRITYDTATVWGLHDRGLVREGMAADLVVFDPAHRGRADARGGARSAGWRQAPEADAVGMHHTIVNGQELLHDNQPTGATPGRLLRS